jgi:photosystem II stability/assembly factor-like uncharacterized protein
MRASKLFVTSVVAPVLLAGLACGPGTAPTPPKPPVTPPAAKGPEPVSPARWVIQSGKVERVGVRLDLGPGSALYVGAGGERWLEHDGKTEAASTLLPDAIVAATRAADGKGVVFATAEGAAFEASDPLGAVGARRAPPSKLHAVAAGRASLLGVNDAGALLRSTDGGASWKEIPLAGARGALVKVALGEGGAGLALFAPQRLYASSDDGATWQPLASPGIGAVDVVRDVNGDVMLTGLDAAAVLKLGPMRFERVSRGARVGAYELANPTARPLGLASATAKGSGALVGDRYLEVIADPEAKERWSLASAPLGGAPEIKRIAAFDGCTQLALAARGKATVALCTMPAPSSGIGGGGYRPGGGYTAPDYAPRLRIVRSEDAGATWKDDATIKAESGEPVRGWLAPDGALFVDGGCKPSKSACYDRQLLVHVPGDKAFAHVGTPRNWPKLRAIAWSADGKKAYALATGNGGVGLLVSRDGGRDFSYVPLPTVPLEDEKAAPIGGSRAQFGAIAVDDKGVVYAAAHVNDRWAIFTTSDDGVSVKGRLLPFRADAVELAGRRGFAYARDGHGYETADGGASWSNVASPRTTGEAQLACDDYGCLVGDRATRVGWGGGTGTPEGAATKPKGAAPVTGTYRCKTEGDWQPIGRSYAIPTAYDAEMVEGGRWTAVRQDLTKGSVAAIVGKPKAKGTGFDLKETPLFAASGKDDAIVGMPQIEGVAALRFHVKRLTPAKGETIGAIAPNQNVDVELAWWVASTGQVKHATIRGVGPLDPNDVAFMAKDSSLLAGVGLLSIAQGGIHVRPLQRADAPLYFASDAGKVEKLTFPSVPSKDPAGEPIGLHLDALRAGNRSVLIGIGEPGVQLFAAWANEAGTSWDAHTWGAWPGGMRDVGFDFTYVGGRPAIVALHTSDRAATSQGFAVPLEPKDDPGEPTSVATQASLGAMPRACGGASSVSGLPRVVAPFGAGTRHPVIVTGEAAELTMATTNALVHGKGGDDGCVRAFEAQPQAWSGGQRHGAIVSTEDLAHSTLFKIEGETMSAKPMSCTLENAPVPASLADVEGFGG